MVDEQEQQVTRGGDFWIDEIRGNIARLNDAAATVEVDIITPTITNTPIDAKQKHQKIRNFHVELRRLYMNAKQILPPTTAGMLEKYFEATNKSTTLIDPKTLKLGIQVSNSLQDALFDLGVKDIGVPDPETFPYEYYFNLLEELDGDD